MSLETAFRRLTVRPTSICHQCRRTFASVPSRPLPQQSATGGLADSLVNSRRESQAQAQVPRSSIDATTNISPPSATATSSTSERPRNAFDIAEDMITESGRSTLERQARERVAALQRDWTRQDLEKQQQRKWKPGDVYAPHDLSGAEAAKWKRLRRKGRMMSDVIDQLGINPIHHYKNFSMMSEYITDMGRIKHRRETSLRPVNQRRMAKAIRRAIGTGMMPGVHRHPEILRLERRNEQTWR
ncbi:uncharacterized protein LTR77_006193 [Saxophila tyrrhenica]|uniref:Small ribosomal subunit protein bS18m n=1 Tax=Saxophila tyrrhenica TaxID=1690608 RepID=A0AAV9P745_9PEZI|nr:hypothetical protein LTR77_006193 [Saxophila tyrrhenica]